MTLFPPTISRSLRRELGPENQFNVETLYARLSKNPRTLIVFFQQATQHRAWCISHYTIMYKMFSYIYHRVIDNTVTLEEAIKAGIYTFKYNNLALSLVVYNPIDQSFSGLIMLRSIPKLLSEFRKIENKTTAHFAPFLRNKEDFKLIYKTFYTVDFTPFHNVETETLKTCLLQSKAWDYVLGVIELQNIYIQRVQNIIEAYETYGFALTNDFSLLREHSEKLLSSSLMLYANKGNLISYSCVRMILTQEEFKTFNHTDICKMANSIGSEIYALADSDYEKLEVLFRDHQSATLLCRPLNVALYRSFRIEMQKEIQRPLPNSIQRLISDGKNRASQECLIGFCAHQKELRELVLSDYEHTDEAFYLRLGKAAPNLGILELNNSIHIDSGIIKVISNAFSHIKYLHLSGIDLYNCLEALNMPKLKGLHLDNCCILPAKYSNQFNQLCELSLFNMDWTTLKEIVNAGRHVHQYRLSRLANFNLKMIPHPEIVDKMAIDAALLELSLEQECLKVLESFKKLNELTIIGTPSYALKKALNLYIHKLKQIYFIKDC